MTEEKETDFEILTLYFNKKRKYKHLTRVWVKEESCAWSPRIINRINLDSTNTFKIAKKDIEKIGVYTYCFTNFIEIKTENAETDYFEINVVLPIDKERMPRNKQVKIQGKNTNFYENRRGKIDKILTIPLKKKKA